MVTTDRQALLALVQSSSILSEPEREYWQSNLPGMTEAQCSKLESILTQVAAPSPLEQEILQFIEVAVQAAMNTLPQPLTARA